MVTTLYFVRHAHSTYSTDELNRPLSEKGRADARRVTRLLLHENINILISSPYKRAIQTIEGLEEPLNAKIIIEDDFRERVLSSDPVPDFGQAISKVWEDFSFAWPGGESNLVAQNRGVQALYKVLQQYKGNSIAIGTHGNMMVLIMNALDKRYDYSFWKQLEMPDIYKLSFHEDKLVGVQRIW
ncbi:histidine phosphatase family protein [Paenibacillus sp. FSL R7-0333]|uniref:histidine phosphatase family protein n=1 Tax=Paenibacillus sp. FSL R7-0333 TaxID=1926587 RepID=UPI00096FF7D9|nr:histidine phosphatase family protein [Paenibacillus sp. FSL R7-0333]